MAFFKLNIPGLAIYFDNSAVYFKTFWQPWACVFFISGENTMTKEEFQKMKQELEA